ncbi:MAG: hypothetical protein IPM82_32325 [Saprospiraceae bacterium]|nr:hypothetical protein [Saprospiraceae bacterium]
MKAYPVISFLIIFTITFSFFKCQKDTHFVVNQLLPFENDVVNDLDLESGFSKDDSIGRKILGPSKQRATRQCHGSLPKNNGTWKKMLGIPVRFSHIRELCRFLWRHWLELSDEGEIGRGVSTFAQVIPAYFQ